MTAFLRPGGERPSQVVIPNDPQLLDPVEATAIIIPGVVTQVVDAETVMVDCAEPLPNTVRAEKIGTGTVTVGDKVMVYGYRKGPMEYWWVYPPGDAPPKPEPTPPILEGCMPLDKAASTAVCSLPDKPTVVFGLFDQTGGTKVVAWDLYTGQTNNYTITGAALNGGILYPFLYAYKDTVLLWPNDGSSGDKSFLVLDTANGEWGTWRRVTVPAAPFTTQSTRPIVGAEGDFWVVDTSIVHSGTTVQDEVAGVRVVVRRWVPTTNLWTGTWTTEWDQVTPKSPIAAGSLTTDVELGTDASFNGRFGCRYALKSIVSGSPFDYTSGCSFRINNGVSEYETTGNHYAWPRNNLAPNYRTWYSNPWPVDADADYARSVLSRYGNGTNLCVWRWDGAKYTYTPTTLVSSDYAFATDVAELNADYSRFVRIQGGVFLFLAYTKNFSELHVCVIDDQTGGTAIPLKVNTSAITATGLRRNLLRSMVWGGPTFGWGGSTVLMVPNDKFNPSCLGVAPFAAGYSDGWDVYQVTY